MLTNVKPNLIIGQTLVDFNIFIKNLENNDLSVEYEIGGKGFNISKDLKFLGQDVVLSTVIANDELGNVIRRECERSKLVLREESILANAAVRTGIFTAIHDTGGKILFDKIQADIYDLQRLELESFNDYSCVCIFSNLSLDILGKVRSLSLKSKVPLVLEIAGRKDVKRISQYLSIADMIICNEREFSFLADDVCGSDLGSTFEEVTRKVSESLRLKYLVVTLGEKGIAYYTNGIYSKVEVEEKLDTIVSAVGAGDSITASIINDHFNNGLPFTDDLIRRAQKLALKVIISKKPYLN